MRASHAWGGQQGQCPISPLHTECNTRAQPAAWCQARGKGGGPPRHLVPGSDRTSHAPAAWTRDEVPRTCCEAREFRVATPPCTFHIPEQIPSAALPPRPTPARSGAPATHSHHQASGIVTSTRRQPHPAPTPGTCWAGDRPLFIRRDGLLWWAVATRTYSAASEQQQRGRPESAQPRRRRPPMPGVLTHVVGLLPAHVVVVLEIIRVVVVRTAH